MHIKKTILSLLAFTLIWPLCSISQAATGQKVTPIVTTLLLDDELKGPDIATGISHSCAIAAADSVYCWGFNFNGQLGNDDQEGSDSPLPVEGVLGSSS